MTLQSKSKLRQTRKTEADYEAAPEAAAVEEVASPHEGLRPLVSLVRGEVLMVKPVGPGKMGRPGM